MSTSLNLRRKAFKEGVAGDCKSTARDPWWGDLELKNDRTGRIYKLSSVENLSMEDHRIITGKFTIDNNIEAFNDVEDIFTLTWDNFVIKGVFITSYNYNISGERCMYLFQGSSC